MCVPVRPLCRRRYHEAFQLRLGHGPSLGAGLSPSRRFGGRITASVEDEQIDVPSVDLGSEPVGVDVLRLPSKLMSVSASSSESGSSPAAGDAASTAELSCIG